MLRAVRVVVVVLDVGRDGLGDVHERRHVEARAHAALAAGVAQTLLLGHRCAAGVLAACPFGSEFLPPLAAQNFK